MKIRLNEESAKELEGELVTVDLRHSGGRGTGMEQDYDEEKAKDNKGWDNCTADNYCRILQPKNS